jgi:hypothetical protein
MERTGKNRILLPTLFNIAYLRLHLKCRRNIPAKTKRIINACLKVIEINPNAVEESKAGEWDSVIYRSENDEDDDDVDEFDDAAAKSKNKGGGSSSSAASGDPIPKTSRREERVV